MKPSVMCVTPTYGRFHLLKEMLWCWLRQTYDNKRLLIVNDQPNFSIECDIPGVTVVNVPERFVGLGAKRNFIRTLIPEDVEYIVTMDDDDLILDTHVENLVKALAERPEVNRTRSGTTYVTVDNAFDTVNTTWPCYGASCFRAEEFRKYWMQDIYVWGEDTDMMRRYNVKTYEVPEGTFIYRRGLGVVHASGHAEMIVADPMHQAMVGQLIQFGTEQYKTPVTENLTPSISPEALALFEQIEGMTKGK